MGVGRASVGVPLAGRDYPSGWSELHAWFPDNEACLAYLERLRWAEGFVCPACGAIGEPWRQSRGRLTCRSCRHQTSVTAGTLFEKTRTPMTTWFAAAWYVTNQKSGANALGLQRVVGVGSYQTAWTMLHKLRRAMARSEREPLEGVVEVDEIFVGGREQGVDGRRALTKSLVAVAVEVHQPRGFGRVRFKVVDDASAASLVPFVRDTVAATATVRTDGWRGYLPLARLGYRHERVPLMRTGEEAHSVMPAVHRVASLLKRWLLGTHQGAVRSGHLPAYLDEFAFRFNRRHARSRGLLFYRLLERALLTPAWPYTEIAETQRPAYNGNSEELSG